MRFADIVGQSAIKKRLIDSVRDNRISHAQLFLGKEGYGTLQLALAYAQYINCLNPTETDSCGECPHCRQMSKLEFPDLHLVFPVPPVPSGSKYKAISDTFRPEWVQFILNNPYATMQQWISSVASAANAQGMIRVDESDEIIRKLSLKATDYKIMVIWYPEKMNADTANKLLKLLEEPYEKTLFLLVAENSETMLKTILSRTQLVKVPRISESDMVAALQARMGIDYNRAIEVSQLSDGDMNQVAEMIETSAEGKRYFELFVELMRACYSTQVLKKMEVVEALTSSKKAKAADAVEFGREQQKAFLAYCMRMVRENLIKNQSATELNRLNENEAEFAKNFARFIHPQNANDILNELDKAYAHIARNASAKIVLFDMCLNIFRYLREPYLPAK